MFSPLKLLHLFPVNERKCMTNKPAKSILKSLILTLSTLYTARDYYLQNQQKPSPILRKKILFMKGISWNSKISDLLFNFIFMVENTYTAVLSWRWKRFLEEDTHPEISDARQVISTTGQSAYLWTQEGF